MIVFKTKDYPDVAYFDQVALNLISLMGHSETVPGALTDNEIEQAFNHLKNAISSPSAQSGDSWDDDSVSMSHRAGPLLDLLQTAMRNNEYVIWEKTLR
ncbi:DUF1840 domain-containing protein [Thiomicrorhabdus sp. 6S3-12]|uniref:DUF1840 domain-containing protein n=1 Tax=Thiomicrorhabdus sp. 6S3-12 TaxID=2819681 RepID=UPI001AAD91EC|nr:DUF1840 domain-containing protein [Thiomicrorhabdus sp. 6S3-12]MBO1924930.1 DUF1840 domain-containing protein [Thiomicrorhabdus sp. 6S3-12]